jgi:DNA-binding beta-propeller fold protein YncE
MLIPAAPLRRNASLCAAIFLAVTAISAQTPTSQVNLPSSKRLLLPVPGAPQKTNSMPLVMAVSPDGRFVVSVDAGYGTFESHYDQSLSILDTKTGKLTDAPDSRTQVGMPQVLYSGIAFSRDGRHLYVSMASTTVPEGGHDKNGFSATGNGIIVYGFDQGKVHAERFLSIPLQQLAPGRVTRELVHTGGDKGVPFPAGLAVTTGADGSEQIVVADNLSDDALLLDAASGKILTRFDLSETNAVPGTYPVAVAATANGKRAFVALWNSSELAELDLRKGTVAGTLPLLRPADPLAPGTHPSALCFSPDGTTLYVSLSNRDAVAAVDIAGGMKLRGLFDTRLPHQTYFGAIPEGLAASADGRRLYVANDGSNSVAVFDPRQMTASAAAKGEIEPLGFVPTEWDPMALALVGDKLYVSTEKGQSTGPNNMAQPKLSPAYGQPPPELKARYRSFTYIPTQLYGSLATLDMPSIEKDLKAWTQETVQSNRMKATDATIHFLHGGNPIKHVIYIIKENRTYDQILGDLKQNGAQVGNGDPQLAMYGEPLTPNQHELALQFGVFDNFYDSAEVSGQGHVWSTAAIISDYLDNTIWSNYRSTQRSYDYEGMVANGYPIQQKIADVNEPASGYLWTDLAAHGKTYIHFGEFISTTFCTGRLSKDAARAHADPTEGGSGPDAETCAQPKIDPGGSIPEIYGGGVSKYPWAIPMIAKNTPTKPELVGHFDQDAPDFNLSVPDQFRVEVFLHRLAGWKSDLAAGRDTMPQFIMLRLGNDHTAGKKAGKPTPQASIADNDLAVGRAVEAISNSAFWESTAFFILEDDSQNGPDHVDAHRSTALVISKYSPRGNAPFVDSHFYTTVSVLRTMETLLGLPPMNNNDAFAALMAPVFSGDGSQPVFHADYRNRDNGQIYAMNPGGTAAAKASEKMDFTHADQADARKLNIILWKDAMGDKPMPPMIMVKPKKDKDDDD